MIFSSRTRACVIERLSLAGPDGLTLPDLRRACGRRPQAVRRALRKLLDAQEVTSFLTVSSSDPTCRPLRYRIARLES